MSLLKKLPNALTLLRVVLIPVFVTYLLEPSHINCQIAFGIFVFASFTDWLDGFLARKLKVESKFGALFDPLADKLLVMAALIMLTQLPAPRDLPAWLVILLLSREMLINGLRSLAALEGTVVPASTYAKHKTAWTMLGIALLLWGNSIQVGSYLLDVGLAGKISIWIALGFSLTTGLAYFLRLAHLLRSE